ncbi:hypothetical protein [Bacillus mycoides]|uniref:hypothetical protein n=1 Tax=Bacillus mycoides TaxID=1405 RepID=UPI003D65BC1E
MKLRKIMDDIEFSQNCASLIIFQNSSEENRFLNSKEDLLYPVSIFNGDILKGNGIVEYLISRFETITEDGTKLFYPSVKTHHIIFLEKFLNNNDKLKIEKLQKRSNIAVYYFQNSTH